MSPADAPIHLRARFDGRVFVPETPVDVPQGTVVELWGESAIVARVPRRAGSAKGLVKIRDDFEAPLDDFADLS